MSHVPGGGGRLARTFSGGLGPCPRRSGTASMVRRYGHQGAWGCPNNRREAGMKFRFLFGAAMLVASSAAVATGLVGITGIASAHRFRPPMAYTCHGGDFATGDFVSIPSGTYSSITVTGVCNVAPGAVINVVGDVNVTTGAVFDAQSAASTITVGHNVTASKR